MKIGLFFGSFNPVHIGHLIIANHILNSLPLKKIWFVVSPQNPLKSGDDLLEPDKRLELLRIATASDPRIKVSDIEFQLPIPSYTIDTLEILKKKNPKNEFVLIIGSDSLQTFDKWKDFGKLLSNYKILVYPRPGFSTDTPFTTQVDVIDSPMIEISSTSIRDLIRQGKSIRYLVPQKVRKAIEKNSYYKK